LYRGHFLAGAINGQILGRVHLLFVCPGRDENFITGLSGVDSLLYRGIVGWIDIPVSG
jgi:hypothetical protein